MLKDPKCLGVGEIHWSNLLLQGNQGERVRELASISLGLGKRVEGHTAGASGRTLQAYSDFGISSCHEPITKDSDGDDQCGRAFSLRDEIKHLEQSLRENGVRLEKPCLTIDTLTTPAIPHLRITHQGYVRLKDRMELSLEV